ncbi:hypothetical protein MTO96_034835 [Rhipicephalus appendiculatus]
MIEDTPSAWEQRLSRWGHSIRVTEFLAYMASVNIGNTPDYKRLKRILVKGVQEAGFKPDSRILFTPPRMRWLNSPRKLVLLKIILAQSNINESGDADVFGSPPAAKVANGRLAPVWGKYRRLPMATEPTSELDALSRCSPRNSP